MLIVLSLDLLGKRRVLLLRAERPSLALYSASIDVVERYMKSLRHVVFRDEIRPQGGAANFQAVVKSCFDGAEALFGFM